VEALAISLDGEMVLVGGSNGTVSLMARDGSVLWSQPTASEITALDLSSMGEQLAVGLRNGAVLFLDKAGHIAWRYEAKDPISSLSISRNGKYLLVGTSFGGIHFLSAAGKLVWSRKAREGITSVALSSSANYAVAGSEDSTVYFLDNYTTDMGGKMAWSYPAHGKIREVAVSTDGFYTAAVSADSTVHFLDKLGKLYWSHRTENIAAALAMSPSGDYLLVGTEGGTHPGQVCLFHRNEGLMWRYITGEATVGAVDISSTGAFMAAGSRQQEVYLFHRNSKLIWKAAVNGAVDTIAISSDGRFTAAGTRTGAVYLYDNTSAVEELNVSTQEEVELDSGFFRVMRTRQGATTGNEEDGSPEQSGAASADKTAETRPGTITMLEGIVDLCLLVVLGLIGGVVYFMFHKDIALEQGLILLLFLLVVMVFLAYLFSTYVLFKPRKKRPTF
jgi:WD40 repeat protein